MTSDDELNDLMDRRLGDGWRPKHADPDADFDPADFAWGIIPCPHCKGGIFLGVEDPDEEYDGEVAPLVTLQPPVDADEDDGLATEEVALADELVALVYEGFIDPDDLHTIGNVVGDDVAKLVRSKVEYGGGHGVRFHIDHRSDPGPSFDTWAEAADWVVEQTEYSILAETVTIKEVDDDADE